MAKLNFDLNAVEAQSDFSPIPAGVYPARIKDVEDKPTKAGNGMYVQLTWEVIDGQYKGRLIWDRLNLFNPNKTAVEIAQRSLKSICLATGAGVIEETDALRDRFAQIKVKVKDDPHYGASNEISGYSPLDGTPQAAAQLQSAPAPQQAAKPATNTPPWMQAS